MRAQTIGCELEAGFVDAHGRPAETLSVLNGGVQSNGHPFEALTSDMGLSSIEFITTVCSSEDGLTDSFDRLLAKVPNGFSPIYKTKPFGDKVRLSRKSRVPAMIRALAREHAGGAKGVMTVAPWCSTQFHTGVPDLLSDKGVLYLNVLNNAGPFARLAVNREFGITGTEGHLMIWSEWGNPDRLPAPRWFQGAVGLERFVANIPKLLTKKNGEWVEAVGEPSRLGDAESEGVLWWVARPRIFDSGPTVEWRPFPSLDPDNVVKLGSDVLALARSFWSYVEENPLSDFDHRGRDVRQLFRSLSQKSYLIPPEPLDPETWWNMFSK